MHESTVLSIYDQTDVLLKRVEHLKRYLDVATELATKGPGVMHFLTTEARGAAVVGVCAELEGLVRIMLKKVLKDLNGLSLSYKSIVPSLRQLAAHAMFESLRSIQDHAKLWDKRRYATTLETSVDALDFPIATKTAQPPLDGKTLKPEHFSRIWEVFSLPGDTFPFVSWAMSLQKLAGLRNDVAHGNLKFHEIFQQAGTSKEEIERYLDDIGEFSVYLASTWQDYLENRRYLA